MPAGAPKGNRHKLRRAAVRSGTRLRRFSGLRGDGENQPGDPDRTGAIPHGCQTARQYFWSGLAVMEFVTLSVLAVSVLVATETQLVRLLEH